jgi:hypothetical protein
MLECRSTVANFIYRKFAMSNRIIYGLKSSIPRNSTSSEGYFTPAERGECDELILVSISRKGEGTDAGRSYLMLSLGADGNPLPPEELFSAWIQQGRALYEKFGTTSKAFLVCKAAVDMVESSIKRARGE